MDDTDYKLTLELLADFRAWMLDEFAGLQSQIAELMEQFAQ